MKQIKKISNNLKSLLFGRLPGQLVIQYSNLCNADCPQCGMRRSNSIGRHTLDKERVREIIDNGANAGIKSLSLTGGEPLMFLDDVVDLIKYATSAGIPYVRTGTNGFFLRDSGSPAFHGKISRIAEKIAATDLYTFWISLDSADAQAHETIRGLPGIVGGIEKALPIFHEHGLYPSVNLGINRAICGIEKQPFLHEIGEEAFLQAFKEGFERFYTFVANLGFTMVNACYPMSEQSDSLDTSLYGAASNDSLVSFSNREKSLIFKALYETIPKFRGKLRIFSPRCSLYGLVQTLEKQEPPLFSCRGGTDFFFVECEKGKIHPCGYLDSPMESLPDLSSRTTIKECRKCEWECFRDPSDLLGPFAELFTHPLKLLKKTTREPQFFKILFEDLRYHKACGFFDGRQPPQLHAMQRFQSDV